MGINPDTPVVGCTVNRKLQRFQASGALLCIVVSIDRQPVRARGGIGFVDQQLIRPLACQLFFE
ncbi:hypothetical protein D3C73_1402720 [compost metagenome]